MLLMLWMLLWMMLLLLLLLLWMMLLLLQLALAGLTLCQRFGRCRCCWLCWLRCRLLRLNDGFGLVGRRVNLLLALRSRRGHINAKSSLHLTVQTQPLLDLQTENKQVASYSNLLQSIIVLVCIT